jgi:3-oxoacyl-[acyl-carrier protein] reductase
MNQTAILTGASGGIGSAVALSLAKKGCRLVLCGNSSPDSLKRLQKECLSYTSDCLICIGDIGTSATASHIVETAVSHFGKVDILINNAGISHIGLITDVSDEEWFSILNTNLSSAFFMCRQVLSSMIHEKKGRILNISSIWGGSGASCEAAYSATKGGLNSLTKALAKEVAPSGIAVNAIACGMIDTKMNSCFSEEEIRSVCEEIPIGRMASCEETAEFISLLLDAPLYFTGQVVGFDGGWQ